MTTLQLPAHHHLASGINAMHLENRLGDVETDCRDRLHDLAPPNRGTSAGTHIHGTHLPVEEPSTASTRDIAVDRASSPKSASCKLMHRSKCACLTFTDLQASHKPTTPSPQVSKDEATQGSGRPCDVGPTMGTTVKPGG